MHAAAGNQHCAGDLFRMGGGIQQGQLPTQAVPAQPDRGIGKTPAYNRHHCGHVQLDQMAVAEIVAPPRPHRTAVNAPPVGGAKMHTLLCQRLAHVAVHLGRGAQGTEKNQHRRPRLVGRIHGGIELVLVGGGQGNFFGHGVQHNGLVPCSCTVPCMLLPL